MFTKINYLCITIIGLFLVSNCIAASDSNLPYKEGELLVKFAPKANGKQKTTNERNQILSSLNAGELKHSYKRVQGLVLVKLPEDLKVKDALSNLKSKTEFLYVEPNYKIKAFSTIPNDTRFSELWGMHNIGQNEGTPNADIHAPEAWDIIHDACGACQLLDSSQTIIMIERICTCQSYCFSCDFISFHLLLFGSKTNDPLSVITALSRNKPFIH
jgi:hypothetical protein